MNQSIRPSKFFGFVLGTYLGIYTRDQYLLSYSQKCDMLNRDFKRLSETIDKQINDEQIIVDSMVRKLEKL